jgi:hypothetical protein
LLQWPVMRYSIDPSFSRIKDCHEMHYQAQWRHNVCITCVTY